MAAVATAVAIPVPLWKSARTLASLNFEEPAVVGLVPFIVLGQLLMLALPVFYFCLYTNRGTLMRSKRLRGVSLLGAIALGVATLVNLPRWIRSVGPGQDATVFIGAHAAWTLDNLNILLGGLSNVACILPLVALSLPTTDDPNQPVGVSNLMRILAMTVALGWGICVGFFVLRLALAVFTYPQVRDYMLQIGRTPPSLLTVMVRSSRDLLEQFGFLVAPYVVWRSLPPPPTNDQPTAVASEIAD